MPSTMPPKKPGDQRDDGRQEAADQRGRRPGDEQGVAAAVEHARGDVAALVVGAQEVVVDVPRRPDRRHAEPEAAGALDHDGRGLAVDDRRAVDRRLERVRVRDAVGVPPRQQARAPRSRRSPRGRRARSGCAAGAGRPAPTGCGRRRGPVWPTSPIATALRHPVARPRRLLDPHLVHERVELRAPDVVADALRRRSRSGAG